MKEKIPLKVLSEEQLERFYQVAKSVTEPIRGGSWGIKSTARFYEDVITAWAEGKFSENVLGTHSVFIPSVVKAAQKVKTSILWQTSTVTGALNTVYGANAFNQLNTDTNLFGLLRKVSWLEAGSGWRAVTGNISNKVNGVAEDGTIPDKEVPTIAKVENTPKMNVTSWGISDLMNLKSRLGDDTIPIEEFGRQYYMRMHVEGINEKLGQVVDTPNGNAIESIDRIVSSNAELGVTDNPPDAGDADISGMYIDGSAHDRDGGAGWTDAYVIHNNGVDANLTIAQLNELIRNGRKNGNTNPVIATNYEGADKIADLLADQQRFVGTQRLTYSINGVQSVAGMDVGFEVATYRGVPIVASQAIVDTTDEGTRVYCLDLNNLFIKVALPTVYLSSEDADKFALNAFRTDYMYLTIAELICTNFKSQGKIRDVAV